LVGGAGLISLEGPDGKTALDRLAGTVTGLSEAGAVFGDYGTTGTEVVRDLVVNDGTPSRKHRKRLQNPTFQFTGIAECDNNSKYQRMAVLVYAEGVTREVQSQWETVPTDYSE